MWEEGPSELSSWTLDGAHQTLRVLPVHDDHLSDTRRAVSLLFLRAR